MLYCIGNTEELVYYKFGNNYGQVFHDYSLNYLSSVNGASSAVDPADTIATDRGAYFSGGTSRITLPINDQVPTVLFIPATFTVVCWIYAHPSDSMLFSSSISSSDYLYMRLDLTYSELFVRIVQNSQDSGEHGFGISFRKK